MYASVIAHSLRQNQENHRSIEERRRKQRQAEELRRRDAER